MANPSTSNYTLGRGSLFWAPYVSDVLQPERHLGDATEVTLVMDVERLEHFSNMTGFRAKDKTAVAQLSPMINFTLDEISKENWELGTYGSSTDTSQTATAAFSAAHSAVVEERYYDLGKLNVYITRLNHGTVTGGPFVVGESVTGATGVGTVRYVGADYLLIEKTTTGFVASETITGGTSAATSPLDATNFDVTVQDVVIYDTDTVTTFYTKGTDYSIDVANGRIRVLAGGSMGTKNITAVGSASATTVTKISGMQNTTQEGQIRFLSDNPEGNNYEFIAWKVQVSPTGDTNLITENEWMVFGFEGEIFEDLSGHPDDPYFIVNIRG